MKGCRLRIGALTCCALALAGQTASQPATRPHFTIGKGTTLIEGPLNPDGTINYVMAANELLGKGVTAENNAAIPLLKMVANNGSVREKLPGICRELKIPMLPEDKELVVALNSYATGKAAGPLATEQSTEFERMQSAIRVRPWKAEEFPLAAAWLKDAEKCLKYAEEATDKDHCFIPFASNHVPATFDDALPPYEVFRFATELLVARAMKRAGSGDIQGSLDDLRRIGRIARFSGEGDMSVASIVSVGIEARAITGYQGLATKAGLNADQLKLVHDALVSLPETPDIVESSTRIEIYYGLDSVMQCLRGNTAHVMRFTAGVFDEKTPIDVGDLSKVDWDVVLRENIQAAGSSQIDLQGKSFAARLSDLDVRISQAEKDRRPRSSLYSESGTLTGIPAVETFVKMRANETPELYSQRIGHWMATGEPAVSRRVLMLQERGNVNRQIALLTVALAEYHLAKGQFPDALKQLDAPTNLHDAFSGNELIYRRQGNGYVLYSVGYNQKDDGGEGDDTATKVD